MKQKRIKAIDSGMVQFMIALIVLSILATPIVYGIHDIKIVEHCIKDVVIILVILIILLCGAFIYGMIKQLMEMFK